MLCINQCLKCRKVPGYCNSSFPACPSLLPFPPSLHGGCRLPNVPFLSKLNCYFYFPSLFLTLPISSALPSPFSSPPYLLLAVKVRSNELGATLFQCYSNSWCLKKSSPKLSMGQHFFVLKQYLILQKNLPKNCPRHICAIISQG